MARATRLEVNSGIHTNHTFSYRLDAKKLQIYWTSWALIGPDTNFREGLPTWVLIWQRNFNTFEASYHPKWKWKCPRPKEHENLRPWNLWTLGLWDLGIYLFMSYSESNVKLRSDYVVEVEGGEGVWRMIVGLEHNITSCPFTCIQTFTLMWKS